MDLTETTSKKELELKDIMPSLNDEGVSTLTKLASVGDTKTLKNFFNKFKKLHTDLESSVNEEQLAKQAIDLVAETGSLIINLKNNTMTNKEIKEGDLISKPLRVDPASKKYLDFIKGKVVEVGEDYLKIDTFNEKGLKISKENVARMMPGQKFDYREIKQLFPVGRVQFKELDFKKEVLAKLCRGAESNMHVIAYNKSLADGTKEAVNEKVKFKFRKTNGELEVKVIKAFQKKIYNREISEEELLKMKKGETVLATAAKTTGESFEMAMFYDKDLEGVRAKSVNTKPLEKAKVYSVDLSKEEIAKLNKGETIVVSRKDKDGKDLTYTVSYNLPLNDFKVSKGGELKKEQKTTKKQSKKEEQTPKQKPQKARKL